MRKRTAHSARDFGIRDADRDRAERLLKETLADSDWPHETCKSAFSRLLKKGLLIAVLFFLCGFLGGFELNSLVPVVVFLIGTTVILVWDWDSPKNPESE